MNCGIERSSFTYNERDDLVDEVFSLNGAIQWTGDFDYDSQTNLARSQRGDTTIDYEYDIRNRLAVATNTTAGVTTTAEYEYDQDGMQVRRTEKSGGDFETEFLIRDPLSPYGYSRVLEKRTPAGILLVSFVHGREPIAEVTASTKHILLADVHSGVRTIVEESSQAIQSVTYDSFGVLITPYPAISTDHLYRTEPYDTVSGQYYLRARHYTPTLAAFSQLDPYAGDIDNPISLHRFQYADRDGIQKHDPNGMFSVSISLGTIAIAGGRLAIEGARLQNGKQATNAHLARILTLSMTINEMTAFMTETYVDPHLLRHAKYLKQVHRKAWQNANKPGAVSERKIPSLLKIAAGQVVNAASAAAIGVPVKLNGFPDFGGFLLRTGLHTPWQSVVGISLTGNRWSDAGMARGRAIRSSVTERFHRQDYVWHHHEIVGIMMYVEKRVHHGQGALGHTGGVLYWELIYNRDYVYQVCLAGMYC